MKPLGVVTGKRVPDGWHNEGRMVRPQTGQYGRYNTSRDTYLGRQLCQETVPDSSHNESVFDESRDCANNVTSIHHHALSSSTLLRLISRGLTDN